MAVFSGEIRYGQINPTPMPISKVCGEFDSTSVLNYIQNGNVPADKFHKDLKEFLCAAIKDSQADTVSIGGWILLTENETKTDTLVVEVRTTGNSIHHYMFVPPYQIKYDTLSHDKHYIRFCISPLPEETKVALIMVHEGTTEADYVTTIIDGPDKDNLIEMTAIGSWWIKGKLSMLFILSGACIALCLFSLKSFVDGLDQKAKDLDKREEFLKKLGLRP